MGNIVLLDELTINKIAAGEVIERPASVVKEMVENSLDAGATNINIEIQNGGISKIRISDNGKGIAADDMVLAFERHATSKIRVADDLETVKSMGFRGEALASIAAIARVEMISRTSDSETGNRVIVEGGKIIVNEPIGASVGTIITVDNLFYNTPVRYKFLKKDYTEAGYIEDAITRLALINPNVSMKLVNSGKTIIQTNGNGDLKSVIYNIYGKDIAEAILKVNYEYEGIKVSGVIGKPEIARSNRLYQIFFVNKRYIKDKTLSSSAEEAFQGLIPIGKFGFLVLNLEMNPSKVDVNVHPAKLEVRFQEENKVFKAVMYAIKESLLQAQLIKNVSKPVQERIAPKTDMQLDSQISLADKEKLLSPQVIEISKRPLREDVFTPKQDIETEEKKTKTIADIFKKISKTEEDFGKTNNLVEELYNQRQNIGSNKDNLDYTKVIPKIDMKETENRSNKKEVNKNEQNQSIQINTYEPKRAIEKVEIQPKISNEVKEDITDYNNEDFEKMYEKTFGDIPASMKPKEETFKELKYVENTSFFDKNEKYVNYKYIGSAFSTFIILEIGDELYIIDQHAAHERIMYEKVKKNFYSETEKDSQLLLVPDVINLTHKEMLIARENFDIFAKAGFIVEEFGDNSVKLSGVPNICLDLNTKSLFLDILDEIDTVARTERQEVEEKFIATVACKSAVKANNELTEQEVRALMDKLLKLPNPFTCPHGRPTAIKMTKSDFEKKFSRRQ